MVKISPTPLNIEIPLDGIGFVVMQPYILESLTTSAPYQWKREFVPQQLDNIRKTLEISRQNLHAIDKTHFTIFPEYSLPGIESVNVIEEYLIEQSWPVNSLVIGGLHGLKKEEYEELCGLDDIEIEEENSPTQVLTSQWVNCSIMFNVSSNNGHRNIKKFIQPKLSKSWPEENNDNDMFEGKGVFLYEVKDNNGFQFRFINIICYDWIGAIDTGHGISFLLERFDHLYQGQSDPIPLHLILVIQCNEKPNHPSFLNNVVTFYDPTIGRSTSRKDCLIGMFNVASSINACGCQDAVFGNSSLLYYPSTNYDKEIEPPTYSVITSLLRGSDNLQTCNDVLFRESGQCVHSFGLRHPKVIFHMPSDDRLPLKRAVVSSFNTGENDPRLNNGPIAASIKWINDKLDLLSVPMSEIQEISDLIQTSFDLFKIRLRGLDADYLKNSIVNSKCHCEVVSNCDLWNLDEIGALKMWATVVSFISSYVDVSVDSKIHHGIYRIDDTIVEIIIVIGDRHSENIKWVEDFFGPVKNNHRLIISKDEHDSPFISEREKPVYDLCEKTTRRSNYELRDALSASNRDSFISNVARFVG